MASGGAARGPRPGAPRPFAGRALPAGPGPTSPRGGRGRGRPGARLAGGGAAAAGTDGRADGQTDSPPSSISASGSPRPRKSRCPAPRLRSRRPARYRAPPQRRPRPGSGGGGLLTGKTAGRSFRVKGRGAPRRFRVAERSGTASSAVSLENGAAERRPGGGSPARGHRRCGRGRRSGRGVGLARALTGSGGGRRRAGRPGRAEGRKWLWRAGARRPRARPAGPLPASRRHVTRAGGGGRPHEYS